MFDLSEALGLVCKQWDMLYVIDNGSELAIWWSFSSNFLVEVLAMSSRKHYVDLWGFLLCRTHTRPSALFLDDKQKRSWKALEKDADAWRNIIIEGLSCLFCCFSQFLCLDQENNVMSLPVNLKIQMKRVAHHLVYIWGHLRYIPRYPPKHFGNHQACWWGHVIFLMSSHRFIHQVWGTDVRFDV